MIQEDKELLLKDLCGRLPYKVKGIITYNGDKDIFTVKSIYNDDLLLSECEACKIIDFKPYLRPMSSMTEDEKEELRDTYSWLYSEYPFDDEDEDEDDVGCHPEPSAETYDWYNRKMFDYRGLIPKGLALEAPEGMYNN